MWVFSNKENSVPFKEKNSFRVASNDLWLKSEQEHCNKNIHDGLGPECWTCCRLLKDQHKEDETIRMCGQQLQMFISRSSRRRIKPSRLFFWWWWKEGGGMKGSVEERRREATQALWKHARYRQRRRALAIWLRRRRRRSVAHLVSRLFKNVYFSLRFAQTLSGWDGGETRMRLNPCLHWSPPLLLVTGWFSFQPPNPQPHF